MVPPGWQRHIRGALRSEGSARGLPRTGGGEYETGPFVVLRSGGPGHGRHPRRDQQQRGDGRRRQYEQPPCDQLRGIQRYVYRGGRLETKCSATDVGHDEPSVLFESNTPGSGNHMRYNLTLPTEPSANNPNAVNKSYAFELSGTEWLGMAMCDTQSFPEQVSTCPPDSDKNILDPAVSPKHVGEAYMEMQFYPPGWIPWPTWQVAVGASSCDPTRWCAALNIDSLSLDPVTGQTNNPTCLSQVGEEYVNFAFITKSGVAQAPANPVDATTLAHLHPEHQGPVHELGDHLTGELRGHPERLEGQHQ